MCSAAQLCTLAYSHIHLKTNTYWLLLSLLSLYTALTFIPYYLCTDNRTMSWKQFIQIIFSTLQEDTLIIVHVQSMLTLKLIFLTMRRDFLSDFLFTALIAFDNKLTLIFLPKKGLNQQIKRGRGRERWG